MAYTVTFIGQGQRYNTGAPTTGLTLTLSQSVSVGDLIVVVGSSDNVTTGLVSAQDTKSNPGIDTNTTTYKKIVDAAHTGHLRTYMWAGLCRTALVAGTDTISLSLSGGASAPALGAIAYKVTPVAPAPITTAWHYGTTLAKVSNAGGETTTTSLVPLNSGTPDSAVTSSKAVAFGAISIERPPATAFTSVTINSSGYSTLQQVESGPGGGSPLANLKLGVVYVPVAGGAASTLAGAWQAAASWSAGIAIFINEALGVSATIATGTSTPVVRVPAGPGFGQAGAAGTSTPGVLAVATGSGEAGAVVTSAPAVRVFAAGSGEAGAVVTSAPAVRVFAGSGFGQAGAEGTSAPVVRVPAGSGFGQAGAEGTSAPAVRVFAPGSGVAGAEGTSAPAVRVFAAGSGVAGAEGTSAPAVRVFATGSGAAETGAISTSVVRVVPVGVGVAQAAGTSLPRERIVAIGEALGQSLGTATPFIRFFGTGAVQATGAGDLSSPQLRVSAWGGAQAGATGEPNVRIGFAFADGFGKGQLVAGGTGFLQGHSSTQVAVVAPRSGATTRVVSEKRVLVVSPKCRLAA